MLEMVGTAPHLKERNPARRGAVRRQKFPTMGLFPEPHRGRAFLRAPAAMTAAADREGERR